MTLKVGDRVNSVSGKYGRANNNPLIGTRYECAGTVDSSESDGMHITVLWDNGAHNSYNSKDLALAGTAGSLNPNMAFRLKKRKRR